MLTPESKSPWRLQFYTWKVKRGFELKKLRALNEKSCFKRHVVMHSTYHFDLDLVFKTVVLRIKNIYSPVLLNNRDIFWGMHRWMISPLCKQPSALTQPTRTQSTTHLRVCGIPPSRMWSLATKGEWLHASLPSINHKMIKANLS